MFSSSAWEPDPIEVDFNTVQVNSFSQNVNNNDIPKRDNNKYVYEGQGQAQVNEEQMVCSYEDVTRDHSSYHTTTPTTHDAMSTSKGTNTSFDQNSYASIISCSNKKMEHQTRSFVNGNSHSGFITTPLITQILNDEKQLKLEEDKFNSTNKMTNEIEATTGINTSKKCSSKSTPQLTLRFLSDQPSVPMRFGKHFDSMNANVFPPKDELHCFLERGHEADDQGLYPIHKACIEYPQNAKLIGMIIRSLPQSVAFKVKGTKQLSRNNSATQLNTETTHKRSLSVDSESSLDSIGTKSLKFINGMYPIHIAVANSASLEVVKLLVRSNPNVLSLTDENGMVPLSLALRCHDRSSNMEYFTKLVNFLIASNPHAATVADVRNNTPLHYACMTYIHAGGVVQRRRISSTSTETSTSMPHGRISPIESQTSTSKSITSSIVPIQILRLLLEANPDAINQPNFNGDTPLALAERSENIDDESITLLQTTAYRDEEVEEAPDNLF